MSLFDDNGRRTESWLYVDGVPVVASMIDPETGQWIRSDYIADGRYRWATVGYEPPLGTAPATLHTTGEQTDVGTVLARWLDREFAAWDQLVVFADGENIWQRGLRRMRHPGVRGVSVLHNSHLGEPYDESAGTKPHWHGFFDDLTNVDRMVCLTGRQRQDLVERYGDLPLEVVHHAVPTPREQVVVPRERHLVFIGRLAEQKRIEHLLDAVAAARARVPDVRLEIYGSGPEEDDVRRWISERGLDGAVEMRGHTTDPLGAFAAARAAVMTSRYEGLPLTLTEGMAVGTPFISYDLNYGPAEVIRDGVDGYLVPAGDVETFADRIVTVLRDDALAKRLSDAAREVVDRFSTDRYRRSWTRVLHDVADGAGPDRGLTKEMA
ncbi:MULTISPECIES: glycosyltransferase [Isoptericola]|uniref:glycosyltransferase n=1 Tax=Isoptericola TaxID=254250 RepID=UPI0013FE3B5E|nr:MULTISPECIES: glycosyltransferase [Isoptericola]